MGDLFAPFVQYGGLWITILGVLALIAYLEGPKGKAENGTDERERKTLSKPLLLKAFVVVALLCWTWKFGRLFLGNSYLRGAGQWAELSTILLGLILFLAGGIWVLISRRRMERIIPWVTYGIVLLMILSSGGLVLDAPNEPLSQGYKNRVVTRFVQGRLANLECFKAAGISRWRKGEFDALTASAVVSFKAANLPQENSEEEGEKDSPPPDVISEEDFQRLARPFPFLFGPNHCVDE